MLGSLKKERETKRHISGHTCSLFNSQTPKENVVFRHINKFVPYQQNCLKETLSAKKPALQDPILSFMSHLTS